MNATLDCPSLELLLSFLTLRDGDLGACWLHMYPFSHYDEPMIEKLNASEYYALYNRLADILPVEHFEAWHIFVYRLHIFCALLYGECDIPSTDDEHRHYYCYRKK